MQVFHCTACHLLLLCAGISLYRLPSSTTLCRYFIVLLTIFYYFVQVFHCTACHLLLLCAGISLYCLSSSATLCRYFIVLLVIFYYFVQVFHCTACHLLLLCAGISLKQNCGIHSLRSCFFLHLFTVLLHKDLSSIVIVNILMHSSEFWRMKISFAASSRSWNLNSFQ